MATVWVCLACEAAYVPGPGQACPDCGSLDHIGREESNMPKITRHGGASYASDIPVEGNEPQPTTPSTEPEGPSEAPASEPSPGPVPEVESPQEAAQTSTAGEEPQRPALNEPKQAWMEYAQACGVDGAEHMTKEQLVNATTQD